MKVNQTQLADWYGVTVQAIRNMQKDGLPVESYGKKGKPNIYDSVKVTEWRENKIKSVHMDPLKTERTRLVKTQADIKEKLLKTINAELLPFELMNEFHGKQTQIVKQKLLTIPSTIKNQLPGIDNKTVAFISKKIKEILNGFDKRKLPADLRKQLVEWVKRMENSAGFTVE